MTAAPGDSAEVFGYAEALELVHRGRLEEARERARQASVNAGAGRRAGSIGDLMAAALTELLASLPDNGFGGYDQEHADRATAIIDIALAANRPAWAAAARAIHAVGLISMGQLNDGLREFETAEVELSREIQAGTSDPWGKPQGVAAGHNNLGYGYLLQECYELALPHLTSASAISRWGYGPELSIQAEMDLFNIGELHLRWALTHGAAGENVAARGHTADVLDAASTLSRGPGGDPEGPWANAAAVLQCGARSVVEPDTLTAEDLVLLQRSSQGQELTFLHNLASCLLARCARLLGEPDIASQAAQRVVAACGGYDPMLTRTAEREATLARAGSDDERAQLSERMLVECRQHEVERQRFSAELERRIAAATAGTA